MILKSENTSLFCLLISVLNWNREKILTSPFKRRSSFRNLLIVTPNKESDAWDFMLRPFDSSPSSVCRSEEPPGPLCGTLISCVVGPHRRCLRTCKTFPPVLVVGPSFWLCQWLLEWAPRLYPAGSRDFRAALNINFNRFLCRGFWGGTRLLQTVWQVHCFSGKSFALSTFG